MHGSHSHVWSCHSMTQWTKQTNNEKTQDLKQKRWNNPWNTYSVGRKKPTSHHRCVRADSGVFVANPEGKWPKNPSFTDFGIFSDFGANIVETKRKKARFTALMLPFASETHWVMPQPSKWISDAKTLYPEGHLPCTWPLMWQESSLSWSY